MGEGSAEGTIGSAQHQEDCRGYLGTVVPLEIPARGKRRQEEQGSKAILGYMVNFRQFWWHARTHTSQRAEMETTKGDELPPLRAHGAG